MTRKAVQFGVLTFPGFPMMAFSAVVEPLRAANTITGQKLYEWFLVSPGEGPVLASNGISINPDFPAEQAPFADYLVVCSGGDAHLIEAEAPLNWLRRSLRQGASIGSVADAAFYLARAGLLDNYECTLHWRSQPAFSEAFPQIRLKRSIYVIDRNRFTSAGGIGAFDMMLDIIGRHSGAALTQKVAEWFVHDRIREGADRERLELRIRTGIRDNFVLEVVSRMESSGENLPSIAAIAKGLNVSVDHIERSFKNELGESPRTYLRRFKLERARDLLQHSSISVRDVGLAAGYSSFSSFVRAFHDQFGCTPLNVRRGKSKVVE